MELLCTAPHWGTSSFLYQRMLHDNRSHMTPKDAFDFEVLMIYLCNTHVKLEIHLSFPDNNVQNGASRMNHYLWPGVVLLMNMHESRDGGREICTTCFLEAPQMVQLDVLSLSFRSQAWHLFGHLLLSPSSQSICPLLRVTGDPPCHDLSRSTGSPLVKGQAAASPFMPHEVNPEKRGLGGSASGGGTVAPFRHPCWRTQQPCGTTDWLCLQEAGILKFKERLIPKKDKG